MTSASRAPLPVDATPRSAAADFGASSERLFRAAFAPIASDTVQSNAAAITAERREKEGCLAVITSILVRACPCGAKGSHLWVARAPLRFEGLRDDVSSNCAQFAAPQRRKA